MEKITLILFTLCMAATAFAAEPPWRTSLPEAADQATKENKLLLLDFTGSDWCGWCKKLDAEVFSKPEFIEYADKNLVLVQVDFPKHKAQTDDLKEANHALKSKYSANGYPTVVVIKPDGTVMWKQTGYAPGGPSAMIDHVNQCRKAAGLAVPTQTVAPAAAAPVAAVPVERPAPSPQTPGETPRLQAILYSAAGSSVVLNGKSCEEGDTVHGIRVVKIARDRVTVESQGQVTVLRLN